LSRSVRQFPESAVYATEVRPGSRIVWRELAGTPCRAHGVRAGSARGMELG
jgi:hypothetical protein